MTEPAAANPFQIEILEKEPQKEGGQPLELTIFVRDWLKVLSDPEAPVLKCWEFPDRRQTLHVVKDPRLAELFLQHHRNGGPFISYRENDSKRILGDHTPLALKEGETRLLHTVYSDFFKKEVIDGLKKSWKEEAKLFARRWREEGAIYLLEECGKLSAAAMAKTLLGYRNEEDIALLVAICLRLTRPPPSKRFPLDCEERIASWWGGLRRGCSDASSFSKKLKPALKDLAGVRKRLAAHIQEAGEEKVPLIAHFSRYGYDAKQIEDFSIALLLASQTKMANLLALIIADDSAMPLDEALRKYPTGVICRKARCSMKVVKEEEEGAYLIRKGDFVQIAPLLMTEKPTTFGGGVHACEGEELVRRLLPELLAGINEEASFQKEEEPKEIVTETVFRFLDDYKIKVIKCRPM